MNNDWKEKALATAANLGKKIGMILLAMLVASLFLLIGGYDFFAIFKGVWIGITSDFAGTIRWTTPLLFASLAVCLSQKANLFNLGVDGQLYLGACTATFVALNIEGLPIAVSIAIIMASGMLGGMIFAAIPALAKIFFGAYEVVTTLLLNFVAIQLTSYLVLGPLKPTTLTGATATDTFPKQLWLPHILGTSDANVGIYIALIVAVLIAIIMYKTVFGQEVKMVGANERYAKYSGISTARITLFTMLIGGAIAGLAGTTEVLGVIHRLPAGFNLGIGFTGIVVALLAQNNPIGCIISSIFFAALKNGATNMQRISDIPSSVSEIVQAMVILMVTIEILLPTIRNRVRSPKISGPVKKTTSSQGGEKDA